MTHPWIMKETGILSMTALPSPATPLMEDMGSTLRTKVVCGIYTRISLDASGQGLGVERQRIDGLHKAAEAGWVVHKVYSDNSKSAFKRNVRRPGFDEMMLDLHNGVIQAIVVWKIDRMTRQPMDLERLIAYAETTGVDILTWDSKYDLSLRSDILRLRIEAAIANDASRAASDRIKRKHQELREQGKSVGGRRAYGYTPGREEVVQEEAEILQAIAQRVIDGDSLREIAADLNGNGIRSTMGGRWEGSNIRRMLLSEIYAGLMVVDKRIVPATWEPIWDMTVRDKLVKILKDPARTGSTKKNQRYLLTGFIYCGVCGKKMGGHPQKHRAHYTCVADREGACGKVARMVDPVEEMVAAFVIETLERRRAAIEGQAAETVTDLDKARSEVSRLELKLALLTTQYDNDDLTPDQFSELSRSTRRKLEAAKIALAKVDVQDQHLTLARSLSPSANRAAQEWHDMDMHRKRMLIDSLIERVVIYPQGRGYRRKARRGDRWPQFDYSKVLIVPQKAAE